MQNSDVVTIPHFPAIIIYDDAWLNIVVSADVFSKVAVSALINPSVLKGDVLFDANGDKWTYTRVSDGFKNTFLARLLAKTFYNPRLDATVIWNRAGSYSLDELKADVKLCVDKDDDIITQFEEGSVIKAAVDASSSFDEIMGVLNKYVFEVNEELLWKEQEAMGRAH